MLKKIVMYEKAIINYLNFVRDGQPKIDNIGELCDGIVLSHLLKSAKGFRFEFGELIEKVEVWGERLKNLRLIMKKIESYFSDKIGKGIKTKDLNLIAIAYNQNNEEIIKLFEVVLALMIEAPNKEDHIQKIMKMDQETQELFVKIIRRIIEQRVLPNNESKEQKLQYILEELEVENSLLRQEITSLQLQKQHDSKELQDLKFHAKRSNNDYESLLKSKELDSSEWSISAILQNQNLKQTIENLNKKLSSLTTQHEIQIMRLRDEIDEQNVRIRKLSESEDILQIYKEKYNDAMITIKEAENWQRDKKSLLKLIDEKESLIKKLQEKLDLVIEENYALEERQVYLQMEIQKQEVRFSQLSKEVKKRIKSNEEESTFTINSDNLGNQQPQQKIQNLQQQVNKLKMREKEALKDKNQLKRTTQRHKNLTIEKKKLQRIILQLTREKREELEVLLGATSELNIENRRMRKLLAQNNIQFE